MKKIPEGYEQMPAKELVRNQYFFYAAGGKRHKVDFIAYQSHQMTIKSSLPNGRQVVRRIKYDVQVIVSSN